MKGICLPNRLTYSLNIVLLRGLRYHRDMIRLEMVILSRRGVVFVLAPFFVEIRNILGQQTKIRSRRSLYPLIERGF